ncbi:MAG: folate-binding protein [Alphaproteobacteria bacterium]|nr:folate-binding protein [Alphaproteobacteria bacterium]
MSLTSLKGFVLEDRCLIRIDGEDRYDFLQGLVSNDVEKCRDSKVVWSAILTPQGKFLYDFFVYEYDGALLLECEKENMMPLGQLLRKYQLRSDIKLGIENALSVILLDDQSDISVICEDEIKSKGDLKAFDKGLIFIDPRHEELGKRLVIRKEELESIAFENDPMIVDAYTQKRVSKCIPEGNVDIIREKGLLLEYGFDELGGVDWRKGCFMGQELTARTKYRALIKKRLVVIRPMDGNEGFDSVLSGDSVMLADKAIGDVRTKSSDAALAFIDLRKMDDGLRTGKTAKVGECGVNIEIPEWINGYPFNE